MLCIFDAIEQRKRAAAVSAELQRIAAWQYYTGRRYARSRQGFIKKLIARLRRSVR